MEKGKLGKYGAKNTYMEYANMYVHILTLTESVLHCSICLNIIPGLMRKILEHSKIHFFTSIVFTSKTGRTLSL
jgi:hypothetical protein